MPKFTAFEIDGEADLLQAALSGYVETGWEIVALSTVVIDGTTRHTVILRKPDEKKRGGGVYGGGI